MCVRRLKGPDAQARSRWRTKASFDLGRCFARLRLGVLSCATRITSRKRTHRRLYGADHDCIPEFSRKLSTHLAQEFGFAGRLPRGGLYSFWLWLAVR